MLSLELELLILNTPGGIGHRSLRSKSMERIKNLSVNYVIKPKPEHLVIFV